MESTVCTPHATPQSAADSRHHPVLALEVRSSPGAVLADWFPVNIYGFDIRWGKRSSWTAVVLIVVLFAVRNGRSHRLTEFQLAQIRAALVAEYTRGVLPPVHGPTRSREQLEATARELEARQDVELSTVCARGLVWPRYVRVEPRVHGGPPPDGKTAQYFEMDVTGAVWRKPSGFGYYLSLF